jgi:ParB family transcriptional regulator, chromosome partitioning protein
MRNTKSRIITVAIANLLPDPKNVRRYQSEAGLTALMASILAQGLLKNLVIRSADKKGFYFVTAGQRRLRALHELAKKKAVFAIDGVKITKDLAVNCLPLTDKHNAVEVSLAENFARADMEAADQIEAFRKLVEEEGMTPEAVADNLGISHMTVRRRVKLAHVAEPILQAFKDNELTLQQLEAYALGETHDVQLEVFAQHAAWWKADNIKNQIVNQAEPINGALMKYVGIKAYEAAGGEILRNLFSDENDGYVKDSALLTRLALAKLQRAAEKVQKAEGFAWAEATLETYLSAEQWPHAKQSQRPMTKAEQKAHDKAVAIMTDLEHKLEGGEATDKQEAAYHAASDQIDELQEALTIIDPAHLPYAGVVVNLAHNGKAVISRGRLRPDDHKRLTTYSKGQTHDSDLQTAPDTAAPISAALQADLRLQRTYALQAHLVANPEQAFALAVHGAALQVFRDTSYGGIRGSNIRATYPTGYFPDTSASDPSNSGPRGVLEAEAAKLQFLLPHKRSAWLPWFLTAEQATLQRVFAYCVARQAQCGGDSAVITGEVERLTGFDIAKHWIVSAAFLVRLTKPQIAQAAAEAGAPQVFCDGLLKLPKQTAVEEAMTWFVDHPWQPADLRIVPMQAGYNDDDADDDLDDAVFEGDDEAFENHEDLDAAA